MGMFDAMPQVEAADPSAQMPQGMMSSANTPMPQGDNPDTSHGAYNGEVDVQGQKVQVKNGVAQVEGQPYFVSDSGAMVVDHRGRLFGHIANGKFEVVTPEYMNKMAEAGYIK